MLSGSSWPGTAMILLDIGKSRLTISSASAYQSSRGGTMPTVLSRPFSRAAGGDRTRNYRGGHFTFLADAADTGGGCSLMEVTAWPGGEPPPHIHTREDEAFYVLDGTW